MNRSEARVFPIETLEPLVLMSASAAELDVDNVASFIAIDLNGDGEIGFTGQTTAKDKSAVTEIGETVSFDVEADGEAHNIEWFDGSGDGILVDIAAVHGNAIDGDALFGDSNGEFGSGFEKLAAFDKDGNGLLEPNELSRLRVWVDNGDGVLDSGELQKLGDHDIFSLRVGSQEDDAGRTRSWAFLLDDSQLVTEDVWLIGTAQENPPLVAVDDVAVTESGQSVTVDVLINDIAPDERTLSVTGNTQAEHGEIVLNADNTLTYTAPGDFAGVVHVQYSISNGENNAIATLRIDVVPPVLTAPNLVSGDTSDVSSQPVLPEIGGPAHSQLPGGEPTIPEATGTESNNETPNTDSAAASSNTQGDASVPTTVKGTDASEWISGTVGDDVIEAGAGNDEIHAPLGNNIIYGGDGVDSLIVYEGNMADYTFTINDDGKRVISGPGANGQTMSSVLIAVERVIFNDGVVDIAAADGVAPETADETVSASDESNEGETEGPVEVVLEPKDTEAATTSTDSDQDDEPEPVLLAPTITGTNSGEWLGGSDDNDDIVHAGSGDDYIETGEGTNYVDGGNGIDTFIASDWKAKDVTVFRQSNGSYIVERTDSKGNVDSTVLTNVERILFKDRLVHVHEISIDGIDDFDEDLSGSDKSAEKDARKAVEKAAKNARKAADDD